MDCLGTILRLTPHFPGKWRLHTIWLAQLSGRADYIRTAKLPNDLRVRTDMRLGYERMVWLQAEEWNELLYLATKLRPGDTFADIGANIGLWTLTAASAVGKAGRVISLEPNPHTYGKLVSNISLNKLDSIIESHPYAASNRREKAHLRCEKNHNLSSIVSSKLEDSVEVDTVPIDELVGAGPITGIKLDTEGYELAAIEGLHNSITTYHPWLIVEFNTSHHDSPRIRDWPVYKLLVGLNYRPYLYSYPTKETPILEDFVVEGYCNVLFQHFTPA